MNEFLYKNIHKNVIISTIYEAKHEIIKITLNSMSSNDNNYNINYNLHGNFPLDSFLILLNIKFVNLFSKISLAHMFYFKILLFNYILSSKNSLYNISLIIEKLKIININKQKKIINQNYINIISNENKNQAENEKMNSCSLYFCRLFKNFVFKIYFEFKRRVKN